MISYVSGTKNAAPQIFKGPLLKEETMEIKNQLQNSDLDGFVGSDGWLEKWKATYVIREKRIVGEGGVCARGNCVVLD